MVVGVVSQSQSPHGQTIVRLQVGDAYAEVYAFGAHVTSWGVGDEELLFLSREAILDGSKPIRGGIPVVFPQFNDLGPLSAHGFARKSVWSIEETSSLEGVASVSFSLTGNPDTAEWSDSFISKYTVSLVGSSLKVEWSVENTGSNSFEFTNALHTYFNVDSIDNVSVSDLYALSYLDNLEGRAMKKEDSQSVRFDCEVDRVYLNTPNSLEISDGTKTFTLEKSAGIPDAVVWNPWVDKSKRMADFGDDEYKKMVCVEASSIGQNQKVLPGESYTAVMTLSYTSLAEDTVQQFKDPLQIAGLIQRYNQDEVVEQRRVLVGLVGSAERVLDFGCGPGMLLQDIRKVNPNARLYGVDISEEMISIAKDRCPSATYTIGSALPFPDASFDVIVAAQVLEYISDVSSILSEFKRVLAPNGHILALDTCWDGLVFNSTKWDGVKRAYQSCFVHGNLPVLMPSLARESGLRLSKVMTVPMIKWESKPDEWCSVETIVMKALKKARGDAEKQQIHAWKSEQDELKANGRYYRAVHRFISIMERQ